MTKKHDLSGNAKIDTGGGFCISTKLTLGGLQYLEKHYGARAKDMDIKRSGATDIITQLTALGIAANPDMPEDEVRRKVMAIDTEQLERIVAQLPTVSAKNPTKGNLLEKESR